MKQKLLFILAGMFFSISLNAKKIIFDMSKEGVYPSSGALTESLQRFIRTKLQNIAPADEVVLRFERGTYYFHSDMAAEQEYYVTNHDQSPTKKVIFDLHNLNNLTVEGNGSDFYFFGSVIPFAVNFCQNITLKDFSIDFIETKMVNFEIIENNPEKGITFSVEKGAKVNQTEDGRIFLQGEDWRYLPFVGLAFDKIKTKKKSYSYVPIWNAGDLNFDTKDSEKISELTFRAPHWKDSRLKPGMVVAARSWSRPTPAIFLNENINTQIRNVSVHYAEGMGLVAQRCTDIALDGFNVCLRKGSKRCYTTHADATHFAQCKGKISCKNGLYENMMDDAINVHGVYLKVIERVNNNTLLCAFQHNQAWGYNWGNVGDSVLFINPKTMENFFTTTISSIKPQDRLELRGMHVFTISFSERLPAEINEENGTGIENTTWTPEVIFSHNTVRNNRARGALFSSPRNTICEKNTFDHVNGTGVLLCGDCNGWYESGPCRNVIIRKNVFNNCLTSYFQFTNAIISIYPEIPNLEEQEKYYHSGIVITDNTFKTFDEPILYAKSVDGLVFKNNKIKKNTQYPPFHWNKQAVKLEKVKNVDIKY